MGNSRSNARMDIREIRRQRLRQFIDSKFSSDAAFAAHVNRQPSYVSRIFSENPTHRRNVGDDLAREIERLCGLPENALDEPLEDPSVLFHTPKEQPKPVPAPQYELEPVEVWDDETPLGPDEVALPFLKEVEVAGGPGSTAIAEHMGRFMRFGKMSLRKKNVAPENAVFVTVTGNSMEPFLRSGSTVGVDRGVTRINDGDVYAIDHNGQLRVKQLYRLPGGGLRLRSYNRDEHPDEEYTPDQVADQNISIIGRVWWVSMYL